MIYSLFLQKYKIYIILVIHSFILGCHILTNWKPKSTKSVSFRIFKTNYKLFSGLFPSWFLGFSVAPVPHSRPDNTANATHPPPMTDNSNSELIKFQRSNNSSK